MKNAWLRIFNLLTNQSQLLVKLLLPGKLVSPSASRKSLSTLQRPMKSDSKSTTLVCATLTPTHFLVLTQRALSL